MTTATQLDEQDSLFNQLANDLINGGETTARFMNTESGTQANGRLIADRRNVRWAQIDAATDPSFARAVLEKVQSYVNDKYLPN